MTVLIFCHYSCFQLNVLDNIVKVLKYLFYLFNSTKLNDLCRSLRRSEAASLAKDLIDGRRRNAERLDK